ncbi:MAG: hypothetical protein HY697_01400 [Deltaproteobacteria bacterium]|nr:hypothetical protein [Deltaproteobacteria bacterium]
MLFFLSLVMLAGCGAGSVSAGERILTGVIVRVVSHDAKAIGSNVGGAFIRIKDLETGAILAQGKQEGGTGDTDRIMNRPHRRGEPVYGTPGAAFFQAEIPLERPTRVVISAEAPLAYGQAMQQGSKTMTLIPGNHMEGEGVIIELYGLIVNILEPPATGMLKRGEEIPVRVEVKML